MSLARAKKGEHTTFLFFVAHDTIAKFSSPSGKTGLP